MFCLFNQETVIYEVCVYLRGMCHLRELQYNILHRNKKCLIRNHMRNSMNLSFKNGNRNPDFKPVLNPASNIQNKFLFSFVTKKNQNNEI